MNDKHPGDAVLSIILRRLDALYTSPKDNAEERLVSFLRPKLKALQPRKNESSKEYTARVQGAFMGPLWLWTRRRIASEFTDANTEAVEYVNNGLVEAFVAGMNESAYSLALTGVEMWPITASIVAGLVAKGLIKLNKRKMKRRKDIAYNEQRTQSAVMSAIVQGIPVEKLPRHVSEHISRARKNETTAYARAAIYGASDSGAYFAGKEAEKQGLDVEKTWLAIMDMNVRPSHKHLHGTTIPLDEKFHGYHGVLRFPHDPEAPPQETYRCRCRMAVHLAGKSPGEYSRKILPTQTTAYTKWRDKQIRKAGGELELAKIHKRLGR